MSYLNAAPLGWSFLSGPLKGKLEVRPSVPSRCADQLASGEVDIGLIPSIEYQRIPDLQIIPGMSIAAASRVRSVLMVQPPEARPIRRVALDVSSRTSVALARVLLEMKMGLRPEYVTQAPDVSRMTRSCDAAVIIGDEALKLKVEDYTVTDLAEAWIGWQGLPFVFAFWACRRDLSCSFDLAGLFNEAKEYGLRAKPEIAARYSRDLGLPEPFLIDYLSSNVDYRLGSDHVEGLWRYYSLTHAMGLIPQLQPLRFLGAERTQASPSSSMFQ